MWSDAFCLCTVRKLNRGLFPLLSTVAHVVVSCTLPESGRSLACYCKKRCKLTQSCYILRPIHSGWQRPKYVRACAAGIGTAGGTHAAAPVRVWKERSMPPFVPEPRCCWAPPAKGAHLTSATSVPTLPLGAFCNTECLGQGRPGGRLAGGLLCVLCKLLGRLLMSSPAQGTGHVFAVLVACVACW